MFDKMTIFNTPSVRGQGGLKGIKDLNQALDKVKVMSDASSAIRQTYQATNQVLGEGSYGKVFLFKSRNVVPEKQYAVKVLLKHLMSERVM